MVERTIGVRNLPLSIRVTGAIVQQRLRLPITSDCFLRQVAAGNHPHQTAASSKLLMTALFRKPCLPAGRRDRRNSGGSHETDFGDRKLYPPEALREGGRNRRCMNLLSATMLSQKQKAGYSFCG